MFGSEELKGSLLFISDFHPEPIDLDPPDIGANDRVYCELTRIIQKSCILSDSQSCPYWQQCQSLWDHEVTQIPLSVLHFSSFYSKFRTFCPGMAS
jgi:hypothetical protein